MTHIPIATPPNELGNGASSNGIVETLIVLAQRKRMIFAVTVTAALIAIGVTLMMEKSYKASTKILPPQQAQSGAAALLAQLGGVAGAAAGAAGIKNPNDLYVGMLKSRTIADQLIEKFKLKSVYDRKTFEMTRQDLTSRTTITSGRDGLIEIGVEDSSPERAAALANSYSDELLRLTKTIAVTEAAQRRLFFERQLIASKENLALAEASLKGNFDKSGVVSVDSQSRAIVEITSRLRAQIAAKEIALESMGAFVTENNQEHKRARQEIVSLKNELTRLENGSKMTVSGIDENKPSSGLESMKVLREVKYHQMLYELLSKQYEVARLDEAKDSSIIQVLDKAQVPELKFKPKRAVIVITVTIVAFLMAIFFAIFSAAYARAMQSPEQLEKMERLRKYLGLRT